MKTQKSKKRVCTKTDKCLVQYWYLRGLKDDIEETIRVHKIARDRVLKRLAEIKLCKK